jgi:hypothetical protein
MLKLENSVLDALNDRETEDKEKLGTHEVEIWVVVISQFTKRRLGARAFSGVASGCHAMSHP